MTADFKTIFCSQLFFFLKDDIVESTTLAKFAKIVHDIYTFISFIHKPLGELRLFQVNYTPIVGQVDAGTLVL